MSGSSLTVDGTNSALSSSSSSARTSAGNGGDVDLSITGPIALTGGGKVSATIAGGTSAGNGGSIFIGVVSSDPNISPSQQNLSVPTSLTISDGSEIISNTAGAGNAGLIDAKVSGAVALTAGGQISSSTTGLGTAGLVDLNGASLTINGMTAMGAAVATGISTSSAGPISAAGSGGEINLTIPGAIALSNDGEIDATTATNQEGGDITTLISPSSLTLASGSQITAAAVDTTGLATGNAGSVDLTVIGAVALASGSQISSGTSDQGDGGTVFLSGSSLTVDGANSALSSSSSSARTTAGNGGDVDLSITGPIALTGGGKVSATIAGGTSSGNGGSIFIGVLSTDPNISPSQQNLSVPTSLTISDGSEIISNTAGAGNAGLIDATVSGAVALTAGGQISSSTTGLGTAGLVDLNGASLTINGMTAMGAAVATGISTSSAGPISAAGSGGEINLTIPGVIALSNDGEIDATTATNQEGGDITTLVSPSSLTLASGSQITAAAVDTTGLGLGNAGSVNLTVTGAVSPCERKPNIVGNFRPGRRRNGLPQRQFTHRRWNQFRALELQLQRPNHRWQWRRCRPLDHRADCAHRRRQGFRHHRGRHPPPATEEASSSAWKLPTTLI